MINPKNVRTILRSDDVWLERSDRSMIRKRVMMLASVVERRVSLPAEYFLKWCAHIEYLSEDFCAHISVVKYQTCDNKRPRAIKKVDEPVAFIGHKVFACTSVDIFTFYERITRAEAVRRIAKEIQ